MSNISVNLTDAFQIQVLAAIFLTMEDHHKENQRELRSFLMPRDPSINPRFRFGQRPETQVRLFNEIEEESDDDSIGMGSQETVDDQQQSGLSDSENSSNEDGALVYLRLRPVVCPSDSYSISKSGNVFITGPPTETTSTSNNKNSMEKHFSFSAIFDSEVQQLEVFDSCIGHKIETEENFTLLTYGTSGSGKTFTLLGDITHPGILPRALQNIFTLYDGKICAIPTIKLTKARASILTDIESSKELQQRSRILKACGDLPTAQVEMMETIKGEHNFEPNFSETVAIMIWVSFVEVYNEFVYDLLTPQAGNPQSTIGVQARQNLKIIGNDGKVFVKGLTSIYVKNSLEALNLLRYGLNRVTYASTSINENSSRSHCLFFVDIIKQYHSGEITEVSYKFCDLAGSERLHKTGNVGSRLKEAQSINTSLLVLGRCLDAASGARKKLNELIPYRESKLTMMLQSALLGKEKLAMVVCVMPTDQFYEENLNVLNFSSIAKNLIFKQPPIKASNARYSFFMNYSKSGAPSNASMNKYNEQLLEEMMFLRAEIDNMRQQHSLELVQQERDLRNELVDAFQITLKEAELRHENEMENEKRIHAKEIELLKRKHEREIEELREEFEEQKEDYIESVTAKHRRTLE